MHVHTQTHTHTMLCVQRWKCNRLLKRHQLYPLLCPHNLLTRCLDWLEIEKWKIYNKLNEGWIPMCKPDRRRRGHAQKQQGEKPPIGAWKECDLLVLLSLLWQGDLSVFSPSQLSLFLFFSSRCNTPPFSFSQCLEEHFFPSELFFLLLNQFPCVISMHGSSSPRVR